MKVRTKLTVGFLVIVLFIWTTVFFAENTYTKIHEEVEELEGGIVPGAIAMSEMAEKAQEIKAWTLVYMIRGNVVKKGKPVKEWLQETTTSLEELAREHREKAVVVVPEEAEIAEELENKAKQLSSAVMAIVNLKDQGVELDELIEKREETFRPIFSPLVEQLEEHQAAHMEELTAAEEAVHQAHNSGRQVLFLVAGLVTLAAVAVRLTVARSIVKPLHALHRGTEIIGQGNLDYKVGTKAKDEIGQLSRAFDQMTEDLGRTTTSIDSLNKEITERKKAEEEREALLKDLEIINRKLEESNRELQDFVYVASHDLREPLRKITSFGTLLQDSLGGKLDEDQQENFEFMIGGSKRMQAMIDDLLTYSRVTTKVKPLEQVNLNNVIEDLKNLELATLLDETKATIHVPETLSPVHGDSSQIHQLLQNLVANGIKFRRKGVPQEITIQARRIENNMVRVEVQDNGIGINEEYYEQVFTMFKRLHSREQYEGTGIGLAVCKKIVSRHGGDIGVKSTPGEGSTFWFTLPRGSY